MSHSNPTQNDASEDFGVPQGSPRPALHSGKENEAAQAFSPPLRGEIFDVVLGDAGETDSPLAPQRGKGTAWFLVAIAVIFCVYNLGAYVGQKSKAPAPIGPFVAKNEAARSLRVQIVGRVKKPGVYTLPGGARIEDAVQKAGGALPGADMSALNLADWAADGSKIEVPARHSTAILPTPTPQVIIKEVFVTPPQNAPESALDASPRAEAPTGRSTAPSSLSAAPSAGDESAGAEIPRAKTESGGKSSNAALEYLRKNPVDLNRATAQQLAVLPGVGPKMAERILAYRHENGGFKSLSDLDNVKGIGEKRMETLKDLVKFK